MIPRRLPPRRLASVVLFAAMTTLDPGSDAAARERPEALDAFLDLHAQTNGFQLGRPAQPTPTPDGKAVLFLRSGPRDRVNSLFEYDVATGAARELLTPAALLRGAEEHLSAEEKARRERQRVQSRGFTSFELSRDGTLLLLPLSGRLFAVRRADGHVDELPVGQAILDPRLAPDGARVAYVRGRDLYVMDLGTRTETRLTHVEGAERTCGLAEFVAQEEMDRDAGYWWSPDGKRLAYQETDEAKVEVMHLGDPTHPEVAPTLFRYPRPGRDNAAVRLFVVEVPAPGKAPPPAREVPWDAAAMPYLSQVSWARGGPLTFVTRSRDQKAARVHAWDDAGGRTRTLLDERDAAWLNVDSTLPRWLPGGAGFLWASDASGQSRLELRAPDGKLVRALSPAGVEYRKLFAVADDRVLFAGSADPTVLTVYEAEVPSGQARVAPGGESIREKAGFAGEVGGLRLYAQVALDRMVAWQVRGGARDGVLPSVAEEPPWAPKVEMVKAGARALRALVVRPRDFDPRRKYPVMVDVYGGPHHQHVLAQLAPQLIRQWIADHGYIVVAIDGRGTPGRGRAFERALKEESAASGGRGSFGTVPLDDQVDALAALGRDRKELDLTRVGIYGWSFGGYLAALAVLRRPDVFHVAVAGAPVVDWRDYDTFYTERYLDLPEPNRAGYDESSLLTYAAGLRRPLLLVHGTTDDNVYFLHSLKLSDALFRAGHDFELLPLLGLTHMVPDAAVRRRLYARILGTLDRALKP